MKVGYRKLSIKKSVKARTTTKAKRAVKSAVIPGYGKKGAGWVKDPKKAAYNKVYSKTSRSIVDDASKLSDSNRVESTSGQPYEQSDSNKTMIIKVISVIVGLVSGIWGLSRIMDFRIFSGAFILLIGVTASVIGYTWAKVSDD